MQTTAPKTEQHKCAKHDKVLVEKRIATKTARVGGGDYPEGAKLPLEVVETRQALCCPGCGIVAWIDRKPAMWISNAPGINITDLNSVNSAA